MSLILKGSPSGTVYAQSANSNLTSSTAQAVYVRFIPSTVCTAPHVFLADKDANGAVRGFSLKQNSPTSMTVGWLTSTGANEHTFTVVPGTMYDVMSVYDRTAATISFYINSGVFAKQFTAVGTPIKADTFCLRITSSPRAGENFTLGDLAVWNNGKPSVSVLAAVQAKVFLGNLFIDSGCTDRYILQGPKLTITPLSFFNFLKKESWLLLEKESISTDPQSTTGDYLPKPNDELKTQVSSANSTYWDMHQMCLNQAKSANMVWHYSATQNKTLNDLVAAGYYDRSLGRFTSMPPRYAGMQSWQHVISFAIRNTAERDPTLTSGTYVLEWEGTGDMGVSGASTSVRINSNRIEFTGGFAAHIKDIPVGGYIDNIRLYRKVNEDALNSGRIFLPEAVEYWGRYDTIRMMDASNINVVHNSEFSQIAGMDDIWYEQIPMEAQIQLAMETDNNLWFNFPAMLGADISNPPLNQWGLPAWETVGINSAPSIEGNPKVTEFFTKFVELLNRKAYPLDRDLRMEMGNELWNSANPFQSAFAYCHGVSIWLESVAPQTAAYFSGVGFLSAMFMTEFQKALIAGGRADQVWTPIIGAQTVYPDVINQMLKGAKHYVTTRTTTFKLADYVVSTTGYTNATLRYDSTKGAWLGATYNTKAEYYAALTDMATNDNIKLQRLMHYNHLKVVNDTYFKHLPNTKNVMATYGIATPIEEYEGSSHNTLPEEEWNTITVLRDTLGAYNISDAAAAIQRACIETFGATNRNGAVSNFQVVGGSATNIQYSAWFEAYNWSGLSSSKTAAVWADYIAAPVSPAVTWAAYKAVLDNVTPVDPVETDDFDAATIRANFISVPTTAASVVRTSGSVFNGVNFDDVDFGSGEFFYKTNDNGGIFTPILKNGEFTGHFVLDGSPVVSSVMYFFEAVNNTWYTLNVSISGDVINFVGKNVTNATPGADVVITGKVNGVNGVALIAEGGTLLSNDNGVTWVETLALIDGVTRYSKSVVASSTWDTIETKKITIRVGGEAYDAHYDVITPKAPFGFTSNTHSFAVSSGINGVIKSFSAGERNDIVYALATPAGNFTIDSTGKVSVKSGVVLASGEHTFEVVATSRGRTSRVMVTMVVGVIDEEIVMGAFNINIEPTLLSNETLTTDAATAMYVGNVTEGTGEINVEKYHDVLQYVVRPDGNDLTITGIQNVIGGIATIAFDGQYIEVMPTGPTVTMRVTVTDSANATVEINYTVVA